MSIMSALTITKPCPKPSNRVQAQALAEIPGFRWFLPTFHGDVQLTARGPLLTEMRVFDLTPDEERAVEALRKKALKPGWHREPWCDEGAFALASSPAYRTHEGATVQLRAPIGDVRAVLAKALKPKRALVSAVTFSGGRVEEVYEVPVAEVPVAEAPKALPESSASAAAEVPKAAVTVAAPVIGCPEPAFPEADVRAARVLETFLNVDQLDDFRTRRAFVAIGADTGHRYLITDREKPKAYVGRSFRSLFDLDERRPLCVHDWLVPPPEEMLALLLCVSLPGRERYVRALPATWH